MNELIPNNPTNWLDKMVNECNNYPVHLILNELDSNNSICIDAGANVGGFSLSKWAEYFDKIVAFDASSYNVKEYLKNVKDDKCKIYYHALAKNDNEKIKLMGYMGDDDITESGNFSTTKFKYKHNNHGMDESNGYEEVDTISLESVLGSIGNDVDLLKIDIEGGEYDFLYKKDLSKIKFIIGEFHNFLFHDNLSGDVNQCDFPISCECDGGRLYQLYEWIRKTHKEIFSNGSAPHNHEIKVFKLKGIL